MPSPETPSKGGARPQGGRGTTRSGPGASDLAGLAARVVAQARPGEQVEAYVARGTDTDIRVFSGQIESLSSATSAGAGIRVIVDGRAGFAYAGSLEESVLAETLVEARDNAGFATRDEFVGLAEPDGARAADLDLWDQGLGDLATPDKVAMALDLEARVRAGDARIRQVESANYGDVMAEAAVASTTGIAATSRRTACYLSAYAIAGEGDESQTGGGYSYGRGPQDLDGGEAADDAVHRATRLLGARKARSRRLPVVFDTRVTTVLMSVLAGTLSGEAVLKGRSLFSSRLGHEVAAGSVSLVDDPTNPAAYGASAYDAEGLACRRNVLINSGVLEGFDYDTYSGRRAGVSSTASAVRGGFKSAPGVGCRALSFAPGTLSQEEILAQVGDGLFVTGVSGVHSGVNPISGDFSVGAEGLIIRNGVLAEPVREVTIASTLQRMLLEVILVGGDLEWLPGSAAGVSLAISDVSMSGA
ncbi:MAG: TldD/PmbA family protein [Acidimicrobiales bacterium]